MTSPQKSTFFIGGKHFTFKPLKFATMHNAVGTHTIVLISFSHIYFISFDGLKGSARLIVDRAMKAGVKLTPAGSTWPYHRDPDDSNIRIAPTYPTLEDLTTAARLFTVCVRLVSAELLYAEE